MWTATESFHLRAWEFTSRMWNICEWSHAFLNMTESHWHMHASHSTWAHTCESMHIGAYKRVILYGHIHANHFTRGAYMRINLQGAHTCGSFHMGAYMRIISHGRIDANHFTNGAHTGVSIYKGRIDAGHFTDGASMRINLRSAHRCKSF